jgi:phenylpropionate dioxygenase-like ring-hydroxylating dioxygenase large terminal subunit
MINNQWYVILESKEIKRNKVLKVKRMGEELAVWRDNGGAIACIADRCCHRGASLSCGKLVNNELECPFHGFLYNRFGKVTLIPANGKNKKVPDSMFVKAYKTYEAHGLIWLWWGDEDKATEKPFFFEELAEYSYASFQDLWNVHYTRAIENQLDVVHLPFVHHTTIGRGNKTLVNGPVVEKEGNLLSFYVMNTIDDGQKEALKANEIVAYKKLPHLQFHYPNIWQNLISDKIRAFAAFIPIDEENSITLIRYYQKMVKVLVLKQMFNGLGIFFSVIILRQDKRIVITQLPKKSELKMDERLILGDKPIVEYRRHRDELMKNWEDF